MDNEQNIIKSIVEGDESAFKLIYAEFSSVVFSTALSYTKNEEEAQDVTQDVFVKIHKSIAKFKQNSSLKTWVYRITVNTCINFVNKKNRFSFFRGESNHKENIDFVHPGVLIENKENAKVLYSVIDTLPITQKTAFILSYIEELPRKEVAEIMETSLKAVESLLQRAKSSMRKKLNEMDYQ